MYIGTAATERGSQGILKVGCQEMHLHGSGRETPQEPSAQDCNQEEQHTGHPQCKFYEAADDMGACFKVDRSFQPARLLLDFISTPTTPKAHDSGKKTHTDKNLLLVNDNTV